MDKCCSQKLFSCSKCPYTTPRRYNLERHTAVVHDCPKAKSSLLSSNSSLLSPESSLLSSESSLLSTPSSLLSSSKTTCTDCGKVLSCKRALKRHAEICEKNPNEFSCDKCHKMFASRASLSNHKHRCKGLEITPLNQESDEDAKIIQNNTITNSHVNSHNTNINQTNNISLLVFPKEGEDFDFFVDHIKDQVMKKLIMHRKPAIGFKQFVGKVLENPSNRIISKSNVKDRFNKVHIGDGKWETDTDNCAMPIVAHHMTTAALQKMEDMKQRKAIDDIRCKAKEFIDYIDLINTDDECEEYKDALDNIKVILVNLFHLDDGIKSDQ